MALRARAYLIASWHGLQRKAARRSTEARIAKQLHKRRAQDYQAYAFRVGGYYVIGPVPDTLTELAILDLVAASGG